MTEDESRSSQVPEGWVPECCLGHFSARSRREDMGQDLILNLFILVTK